MTMKPVVTSTIQDVTVSLHQQLATNSIGMHKAAYKAGFTDWIERDRSKIKACLAAPTDLGFALDPDMSLLSDQQRDALRDEFNAARRGAGIELPAGVTACSLLLRTETHFHLYCITDEAEEIAAHVFHYDFRKRDWTWLCHTSIAKRGTNSKHYGWPEGADGEGAARAITFNLACALVMRKTTAITYTPTSNIMIAADIDADALWAEYGGFAGTNARVPVDMDLGDAVYSIGQGADEQHLYARTDRAADTIMFHQMGVTASNTVKSLACAVLERATGEFTFTTDDQAFLTLITRVIGVYLAWDRGPKASIPLFRWELERNKQSGLMQFYIVVVGSDLDAAMRDKEEPASVAENKRKQKLQQAAASGAEFSEQIVVLARKKAPEEAFLQAMVKEMETNPAFALREDLPAGTTRIDAAKDMLRLMLEECDIPYPKPSPTPRPKPPKGVKRERMAPLNAEHRALKTRIAKARTAAGNTQNKERAGVVYIMTTPMIPDHVKIGSCQDPNERLATYNTGCPFRSYHMPHLAYSDDRKVVEELIKLQQAAERQDDTEWYRLTIAAAHAIVTEAVKVIAKTATAA